MSFFLAALQQDQSRCPAPHRRPLLDTHQGGVLGSHTGSLHQQLLVSQLHSVQSGDGLERHRDRVDLQTATLPSDRVNVETHLVVEVDVHVFAEGVSLGQARGAVLHQVEGLEGPEGGQQLFHLTHKTKNDTTLHTSRPTTEAPDSSQP